MKHTLFLLVLCLVIAWSSSPGYAVRGDGAPGHGRGEATVPPAEAVSDRELPDDLGKTDVDPAEAPKTNAAEAVVNDAEDAAGDVDEGMDAILDDAEDAELEARVRAVEAAEKKLEKAEAQAEAEREKGEAEAEKLKEDAEAEAEKKSDKAKDVADKSHKDAESHAEKAKGGLSKMDKETLKHEQRVAKLERIRDLMEEKGNTEAVEQIDAALKKEDLRFEKKMTKLRELESKATEAELPEVPDRPERPNMDGHGRPGASGRGRADD